jgi:hypothetical protein
MNTVLFNCTQQELYMICRLGWQRCSTHLHHFSQFKTKYTAAYIAAKMAEVENAAAIPDIKSRVERQKTLRDEMQQAEKVCLALYQSLKRYIDEAYPTERIKSKLQSAGQGYFKKAQNHNRNALLNLNVSAVNFIKNNMADLTSKGAMPDNFLTLFEAAKVNYSKAVQAYAMRVSNKVVATAESIAENNKIYKNVILLFKDGQRVFWDTPSVKKQFTYREILKEVRTPSVSLLKKKKTIKQNTQADNNAEEMIVLTELTFNLSSLPLESLHHVHQSIGTDDLENDRLVSHGQNPVDSLSSLEYHTPMPCH